MPKKYIGENSKAAIARARKAEAKLIEKAKQKQDEEDAKWKDNDRNIVKKQQKREELERKKNELLQKKAETKALLEQEMKLIKQHAKLALPQKVTRAEIITTKTNRVNKAKGEKKIETHLDVPVEKNINRIKVEGEEARNITEAIGILSTKDDVIDKHPEKRMKAAHAAYEERRLIELKLDHPTLRQSQMKQMIFKEWQKSPENPLNKAQ